MSKTTKAALPVLFLMFFGLMGCQTNTTILAAGLQPAPTVFSGMSAQTPTQSARTEKPKANPHGNVVQVDISQNAHPISPLIYGVSGGNSEYLQSLRPALISWGGNPSTRYNWQIGNAWNAGKDWVYKNVNYGYKDGVSAADEFFQTAKKLGITTRLAIPTLGWVAKDRTTCSFPKADGSCGVAMGANCKQPGAIADPNRANVPSNPDTISQWMVHLKDQGLVPDFIAMDNEPELWGYTHYDVHPNCTTFEEVLTKYQTYADTVRKVLPQAELVGPASCCWYSYWNTAPGPVDRKGSPPTDYIAWFLYKMRQHDEATGQRSLDVLDLHFYPQSGVHNKKTDPETNARRLRSTRALWDPSYTDESWIKQPIDFIPRMSKLIDKYYPGTRLGISEWNFGADDNINGALAIADVLGIFGHENVYYATYWQFPAPKSPGFYALKMYTNYDDQGSRFGGSSVWADSNNIDTISSYAAYDKQNGRLQIMLINKRPDQPISLNVQLSGYTSGPSATLYRYSAQNPDEIVTSEFSVTPDDFQVTLPPSSISLIILASK